MAHRDRLELEALYARACVADEADARNDQGRAAAVADTVGWLLGHGRSPLSGAAAHHHAHIDLRALEAEENLALAAQSGRLRSIPADRAIAVADTLAWARLDCDSSPLPGG